MLFEMYRETEEDLGSLDLKENLDFLFEDQRYVYARSFFFCPAYMKVDFNVLSQLAVTMTKSLTSPLIK